MSTPPPPPGCWFVPLSVTWYCHLKAKGYDIQLLVWMKEGVDFALVLDLKKYLYPKGSPHKAQDVRAGSRSYVALQKKMRQW